MSKVTSGVTPAGRGIEDELRRFVGVTPAGTVVCALAEIVISIRAAIERIATIFAVTFAVFLDKFNLLFSFGLFTELGKSSAKTSYMLAIAFMICLTDERQRF